MGPSQYFLPKFSMGWSRDDPNEKWFSIPSHPTLRKSRPIPSHPSQKSSKAFVTHKSSKNSLRLSQNQNLPKFCSVLTLPLSLKARTLFWLKWSACGVDYLDGQKHVSWTKMVFKNTWFHCTLQDGHFVAVENALIAQLFVEVLRFSVKSLTDNDETSFFYITEWIPFPLKTFFLFPLSRA